MFNDPLMSIGNLRHSRPSTTVKKSWNSRVFPCVIPSVTPVRAGQCIYHGVISRCNFTAPSTHGVTFVLTACVEMRGYSVRGLPRVTVVVAGRRYIHGIVSRREFTTLVNARILFHVDVHV
jgi:hypothetical protein